MPGQFVLDCSVVMAWCFEDETNPYADTVLESLSRSEALTPTIWPLEIGNVLQAAQRKKRLNEASAIRFLTLLQGLPITIEQESPARMLREIYFLAGEHDISTYDASYLDLAMRTNLPLATLDKKLNHALKKAGVRAFDPKNNDHSHWERNAPNPES